MNMTMGQLTARLLTFRDIDKAKNIEMAKAVNAAMSGDEKAWNALTE